MDLMIDVCGLAKTFVLHRQHGTVLPVLDDMAFSVNAGECLVLHGPSGTGKSTLLRTLYGNYLPSRGRIAVRHRGAWLDIATAEPRQVLDVRRLTMGYVSQFLRVIPRVSCLDVVMEPALARGQDPEQARARASSLLEQLSIPGRLWALPPNTFSGGEQQRVNLARSFMVPWPVVLLDEPTASLDDANRAVVLDLIRQAKHQGAAMIAISHDAPTRSAIADRYFDMSTRELADVC